MMEVSVTKQNEILNALIKNSLEMLEFYKRIYNFVKEENLKQIFSVYINRRKEFIEELKNEALKADPEKSFDNILNSLFKVIENSDNEKIIKKNQKSILSECEKNEMSSVKIYQEALDEELPHHLKDLLSKQLDEVKEAHYHMKLLRDSRS
jgi:uncharacterized protein (TIGR02284 family)